MFPADLFDEGVNVRTTLLREIISWYWAALIFASVNFFYDFANILGFESLEFSFLSETHSLAIGFQLNKITF